MVTLLGAVLISGCTNSRFIVGTLYGRLDERLESRLASRVDLDRDQERDAEALIDAFHLWHRRSELPRYAALLDGVATEIRTPEALTPVLVSGWIDEARTLAERALACHPVNFGAGLARSLDDAQVRELRVSIIEEQREARQDYLEQTAEERRDMRIERFETWAGRIGIDLDTWQRGLVRDLFTRQHSLRQQWFTFSEAWYRGLFAILDDRDADDLAARLRAHMSERFAALEAHYPEAWRENRALYEHFALAFARSLSDAQRADASAWMRGMADTLRAIAADGSQEDLSAGGLRGCRPGENP